MFIYIYVYKMYIRASRKKITLLLYCRVVFVPFSRGARDDGGGGKTMLGKYITRFKTNAKIPI